MLSCWGEGRGRTFVDGKNIHHLKMVPTITEVFLHSLLLYRKSSSLQGLLESKKEIGGNHAFFKR